MADIYDITEEREVVSVMSDQLSHFDYELSRVNDNNMVSYVTKIKSGEMLVLGQIVLLSANNNVNVIGSLPAVVTAITRPGVDKYEYELTMLTGNFDTSGELIKVKLNSLTLKDSVVVDGDVSSALAVIKDNKLGKSNIRELKLALRVPHILAYNKVTEKFDSLF